MEIEEGKIKEHIEKGKLLYKKGMIDATIEEYKAALRMDADSAEAHYNLGNAFLRKELLDEARKEYEEALRIDPAYEHIYTAKYPTRFVKQVGFLKGNDEYLLLYKVFSRKDFEKYECTFDECIQSFKFKREERKQNIKKDDKESGSEWNPAYS